MDKNYTKQELIYEPIKHNNIIENQVRPTFTKYDYTPLSQVKPFAGKNTLEIKIEQYDLSTNHPTIDKQGAICAFFICDLPFDC